MVLTRWPSCGMYKHLDVAIWADRAIHQRSGAAARLRIASWLAQRPAQLLTSLAWLVLTQASATLAVQHQHGAKTSHFAQALHGQNVKLQRRAQGAGYAFAVLNCWRSR